MNSLHHLSRLLDNPAIVLVAVCSIILPFARMLTDDSFNRIVRIALLASVAVLCWCAWNLAVAPYFWDHVEPQVASVGALAARGEQIFHAPDAPQRYAIQYGPATYLLVGLVLKLPGASVSTVRWLPLLLFAATILALLLATRRCSASTKGFPLAATASLVSASIALFPAALWLRPDPVICFLAAWGVVFAQSQRSSRWVLLGASAAALLLTKVFAPIFVLPGIISAVVRSHLIGGKFPFRVFILMAVGVLLVFGMVAMMPQVSLPNHIYWLLGATRHGADPLLLRFNVEYLVLVSLLCVAVRSSFTVVCLPNASFVMAANWMVLAVMLGFGSKTGAGWHYFLPAVPSLVVFGLLPDSLTSRWSKFIWRGVFLSGLLTCLVLGGIVSSKVLLWRSSFDQAADVSKDAMAFLRQNPRSNVAIGSSGFNAGVNDRALADTRAEFVHSGQSLFLDTAAMVDMAVFSNPECDARVITQDIDFWIFPVHGAPFGGFPYSDVHREALFHSFTREGEFGEVQVWRRKPHSLPLHIPRGEGSE